MRIRLTWENSVLVLGSITCTVMSMWHDSTNLMLAAMLALMWSSVEFTP